jgi:hypothetical protein
VVEEIEDFRSKLKRCLVIELEALTQSNIKLIETKASQRISTERALNRSLGQGECCPVQPPASRQTAICDVDW